MYRVPENTNFSKTTVFGFFVFEFQIPVKFGVLIYFSFPHKVPHNCVFQQELGKYLSDFIKLLLIYLKIGQGTDDKGLMHVELLPKYV